MPPDLEARFIEHDLQERCTAGLGIAPSQFEVVVREGSGADDVGAAIQEEMEARGVDVLVIGCHGIAGPRVGTLGSVTASAVNNVPKTVVVANPYAAVTTDAGSRSALFLSVRRGRCKLHGISRNLVKLDGI